MNCEAILYDIEIRKKINPPMFKVEIDKEQIKQVLINIIQNSIEAMPTGGILTIDCGLTCNKEGVTIRIKDTGTGIESDDLRNIYNPFFLPRKRAQVLDYQCPIRLLRIIMAV